MILPKKIVLCAFTVCCLHLLLPENAKAHLGEQVTGLELADVWVAADASLVGLGGGRAHRGHAHLTLSDDSRAAASHQYRHMCLDTAAEVDKITIETSQKLSDKLNSR